MSKLKELTNHLRPGQVYRRADLAGFSKSADRHLRALRKEGRLQKVSGGLYYYPKKTSFGDAPPKEEKLIEAFLKDDDFYVTSLNAYNALGVGTTQLYNEPLVYNHKRDGRHMLNGRPYYFVKRPRFPKKTTQEFLLVDLINNLDFLAEDKNEVRKNVVTKAGSMDQSKLKKAVRKYGGARTRKFFKEIFDGSR